MTEEEIWATLCVCEHALKDHSDFTSECGYCDCSEYTPLQSELKRCPHDEDAYVLIATVVTDVGDVRDVPAGGHIFCPECEWHGTWTVQQFDGPQLRARIGEWSEDLRRMALGEQAMRAVEDLPEL